MRLREEQPDWRKLIELVGDDGAAALSAVYGGGRLYVPRFLGAHHPITECVGPAGAARVSAEFGGGHVDIPINEGKRAQAMQLLQAGKSVPFVCRRVGLSRRHVFYLKDELKGGPGRGARRRSQPDLFG